MIPRLSRTQRYLLGVFAAAGVVDIVISSVLFYAFDGYTEANPVFAWAVGSPLLFVPLLIGAKLAGVALVAVMTAAADRAVDGAGDMVAGTASGVSVGLLGVMVAGLV